MRFTFLHSKHDKDFQGYTQFFHYYLDNKTNKIVRFYKPKKLLSENGSYKVAKGQKFGYDSFILYLRPANNNTLGVNLCPFASPECTFSCLGDNSGRMVQNSVNLRQDNKTKYYIIERKQFIAQLEKELTQIEKRYKKKSNKFCVRLNGISDINFIPTIKKFPNITFYDYTKNFNIAKQSLNIKNYHVTFSFSGRNWLACEAAHNLGLNIAVPFKDTAVNSAKKQAYFPAEYMGIPVINGDTSDLRFLDTSGVIVGLHIKGLAYKKNTSFVINAQTLEPMGENLNV